MLVDVASGVFLAAGLFFALTGSFGVLRMPDFYSRLHPAGKSDSFAQVLVLIGLALQADGLMIAVKLALLSVILLLTSPTATHAITKAARLDGLLPWVRPDDPEAVASRELSLSSPILDKDAKAAETIALYSRLQALASPLKPLEEDDHPDEDEEENDVE